MHMTKPALFFLTATLSLVSSVALAAETNTQSDNGQINFPTDTSRVVPDARKNTVPNNVDSSNMSSGGIMLHPNGSPMNHERMTKDEMHKNTMCKGGRCPGISRKAETGNSTNNDTEIKTDDTTQ